jgi:hypothetical protein
MEISQGNPFVQLTYANKKDRKEKNTTKGGLYFFSVARTGP